MKEVVQGARRSRAHRVRGAGLRPSAWTHRGVPRRGVHGRLRAEGASRDRRRRRRRRSGRASSSSRRHAPARSATARCGSCRSRRVPHPHRRVGRRRPLTRGRPAGWTLARPVATRTQAVCGRVRELLHRATAPAGHLPATPSAVDQSSPDHQYRRRRLARETYPCAGDAPTDRLTWSRGVCPRW